MIQDKVAYQVLSSTCNRFLSWQAIGCLLFKLKLLKKTANRMKASVL